MGPINSPGANPNSGTMPWEVGGAPEESQWEAIAKEENDKEPIVVFYGFQGKLAAKYSILTDKTQEEARGFIIAVESSAVFYRMNEWEAKMLKTNETFQHIDFAQALGVLRAASAPKKVEEIPYEEAEEAEFDEHCLPGCCPGRHVCGK